MDSRVQPTPREHGGRRPREQIRLILPHGHSRRIPDEAAFNVADIPTTICCPEEDRVDSENGREDAAPTDVGGMVAQTPEDLGNSAFRKPESTLYYSEESVPLMSPTPDSQYLQREQYPDHKSEGSAAGEELSQQRDGASDENCPDSWTATYHREGPTEPLKYTTDISDQAWDTPAETEALREKIGSSTPVKVAGYRMIQSRKEVEGESVKVIYIDYNDDMLLTSYFGDDGSVEVPDKYQDLKCKTSAEILVATGVTLGVIATCGAAVVGGAALVAGLVIGIAAKEAFKRVTNDYDI